MSEPHTDPLSTTTDPAPSPFAMMTFSEHPIYSIYESIYELAPPVAKDPLHDQQLAAAIMKIGLAWIMFAAVVVVFQRWRRKEAAGGWRGRAGPYNVTTRNRETAASGTSSASFTPPSQPIAAHG